MPFFLDHNSNLLSSIFCEQEARVEKSPFTKWTQKSPQSKLMPYYQVLMNSHKEQSWLMLLPTVLLLISLTPNPHLEMGITCSSPCLFLTNSFGEHLLLGLNCIMEEFHKGWLLHTKTSFPFQLVVKNLREKLIQTPALRNCLLDLSLFSLVLEKDQRITHLKKAIH